MSNSNSLFSPDKLSTLALICANVTLALIALFQEWGFYYVLLVFWFEALIIGFYNLIRIFISFVFGNPIGMLAKWITITFPARFFFLIITTGFFVTKFGAFAMGAGFLILILPVMLTLPAGQTHSLDLSEVIAKISPALGDIGPDLRIAIAVLFISHGISLIFNYVIKQEYKRDNVLKLLFFPYARMFLVAVVVALGMIASASVPSLNRMTAFSVTVILLKLLADLLSHLWEHRSEKVAESDLDVRAKETLR